MDAYRPILAFDSLGLILEQRRAENGDPVNWVHPLLEMSITLLASIYTKTRYH